MSQNALHMTPPLVGSFAPVAVTATTILAAPLDLSAYSGKYVTIVVDTGAGVSLPFYYQLGSTADGGGTRTSGSASPTSTTAGTAMMFEPSGRLDIEIGPDIEIRVYAASNGYLRVAPTSPAG
jgi:hypothetical protein